MKTNFRFLALSAAILSMFTACQREELEQNQKPEALTHSVTFVAGAPETKTTVDISDGETAKFKWTKADEGRFTAYENGIAATKVTAELGTDGTMSMKATFPGEAPASPKYQALYNSEVSANQNIVKNSYAEVSDVMVSNVLDGTRNDNFVFSFKREVAFAKMTLKDLTSGAYVSRVTIESDKPIAGKYDLKTGTFVNTSNVITLDVLTDVADGNATVWFTTIPIEDATFTITAETINEDMTVAATYTKTFSKTITLTRGDVKGFGVAMVKEVVAAPEPVVLYCSDVTTSGYVSNATHVVNTSLPFEYLQIMANGKNSPTGYGAGQVMQFKSSLGEIYNTESFGSPVKYVEVYAQSSNPFYVYYGDSKAPSENRISRPTTASGTKTISIEDNYGNKNVEEEVNYYLLNLSSYNANYVRIVNGSSTNYFYKIVLLFDEPETVKVTGIELDKTKVTINEGKKTTLTATIAPADATIKDVNWTSDNEAVATVKDGVVSGLSVGSATITATTVDGEFKASCDVTVTAAPAWSKTYTSNVDISGAKVKIGGVEYDAIQVGTSSKKGSQTFKVPANTTKLYLHVVGWNGEDNKTHTIKTSVGTISSSSITTKTDSGANNKSPFTLSSNDYSSSDYFYEFTLSGVTSQATITISNSAGKSRGVYFGINAE